MQARTAISRKKISTSLSYFSGDERQPSNGTELKNSVSTRRRSTNDFNKRNLLSKQSQTAETLEWLSQNYELIQGVCVPRCVLYTHYLDFCKKRMFSPTGAATFGKLIRQRFPKLTTRRLGTRGQSKYHYYGISIKETSVYYHGVYSGKGLTRFSGTEERSQGATKKFSLDKKCRNFLPEFPNASEMVLNENLSVEKVETFILMYRTHCQRLLDTVLNANFAEVHKFLLHFWRGMPEHMAPVLVCEAVVDIIVVCDSLLYKIFNDVLVPSRVQDIPDSLTEEIQEFAVNFMHSLQSCLEETPELLKNQKLKVAKQFVRLLKRNMSFINLAQTARPVFLSYESMSGILTEFRSLDLRKILSGLLFLTEQENFESPILLMFMEEFENLMVKQAPLESYAEWFDSIVEEYVLSDKKTSENASSDLSQRSETFLTSWSFITSRILQELTMKGSHMFSSFQLIIMMFEEYVLLIIENQLIAQFDAELNLGLTRHLRKEVETNCSESNVETQSTAETHNVNGASRIIQAAVQSSIEAEQTTQKRAQHRLHLVQNVQQDFQHFDDALRCSSQREQVQKHCHHNGVQTGSVSRQENLSAAQVCLQTNATPSEIYRSENVTGNHAQGSNFNFQNVSGGKNLQNFSQATNNLFESYSDHFGSYILKGQSGQGHLVGQSRRFNLADTIFQRKSRFVPQIRQVLYRDSVDEDEGQRSDRGQIESSSRSQPQCQSFFTNDTLQRQNQEAQAQQSLSQGIQGQDQESLGQGQQSQGQGQERQGHGHFGGGFESQDHGQHPGYVMDFQNINPICNQKVECYRPQNQTTLNPNFNCKIMNNNYLGAGSMPTGTLSGHRNNSNLIHSALPQTNYHEKPVLPSFLQLSSNIGRLAARF